jgi:hypothetical protein
MPDSGSTVYTEAASTPMRSRTQSTMRWATSPECKDWARIWLTPPRAALSRRLRSVSSKSLAFSSAAAAWSANVWARDRSSSV